MKSRESRELFPVLLSSAALLCCSAARCCCLWLLSVLALSVCAVPLAGWILFFFNRMFVVCLCGMHSSMLQLLRNPELPPYFRTQRKILSYK